MKTDAESQRDMMEAPKLQPFLIPCEIGVLKNYIREALECSARTQAETIKVEVIANVVVLKGTIRSWAERQAIERAAWSTPGVRGVQDDLVMLRM